MPMQCQPSLGPKHRWVQSEDGCFLHIDEVEYDHSIYEEEVFQASEEITEKVSATEQYTLGRTGYSTCPGRFPTDD